MKKTKWMLVLALLMVFALAITACATKTADPTAAPTKAEKEEPAKTEAEKEEPAKTEAEKEEPAKTEAEKEEPEGKEYIAVISKGFQHQFWQTVYAGSKAAAEDLGVEITFEGPPSETDIAEQVGMLNAVLAKQPVAVALAALSTESVMDQLQQCLNDGIPVIGFDSGVPNAPEGAIKANASTDNKNAGALAAEHIYAEVKDKLAEGTTDAPVRIAVISQDATSESVTGRTIGFIDKIVELIKADGIETVAVIGHDLYKDGDEKAATVLVDVGVSADTEAPSIKTATEALLNKDNVVALFGSNEAAAKGILDATNEGADLAGMNVVAAGFDAGERQKKAVAEGYLLGSVTQDPFQIGYKAVELAYKAYKGESVEDVDTGAKFYTKDNMEEPDIAQLLYD